MGKFFIKKCHICQSNKSIDLKHQICHVQFDCGFKSALSNEKDSITITRKKVGKETPQYNGGFGAFKSESILPIQLTKMNKEMALFDLQTLAF